MKKQFGKRIKKSLVIFSAVIVVLLSTYTPAFAQQDAGIDLFSNEQRGQSAEMTADLPEYVSRARVTNLNPAALDVFNNGRGAGQSLNLNLFEDVHLESQIQYTEATQTGGDLLKGIIPSAAYSEVTLVYQDNNLTGGVAFNDQYFKIETDEAGVVTVSEIDQTGFQEAEPIQPVMDSQPSNRTDSQALSDSASEIDIMVVYTTNARVDVGGTAAMNNLINLAISETNTGYANSGINHRFILVHTHEFNYSAPDYGTMLTDLQDANGDVLDQVHSLRNAYSADIVVMLAAHNTYCGLGYLMTNPSVSFANYAFSVVSVACATGYYSFGHETGHNMGSHHNRQAAGSQTGAYSYSYGYYNEGAQFRTVMSYACPGNVCTRVNYWSNPYVYYNGQPTGIVETAPNAAFNALSMNNTAIYAANFRTRPFDVEYDEFSFIPLITK